MACFVGFRVSLLTIVFAILNVLPTCAADNELTAEEKADGWQLLFNGRNLDGWKNNDDKPVAEDAVQDGTINTHGVGGYLLVFDKPYGDFEISCDVKMCEKECNSGIFFHVSDLADPVNTGLEAQVFFPLGTSVQDFGAIYDLVPPSKVVSKGPGNWDSMVVRCEGPMVTVTVNGEQVAQMNCDEFDKPGLRPDGTKHKFPRAIKDFARTGYIGLQDHGHDVWFKNFKLRELAKK